LFASAIWIAAIALLIAFGDAGEAAAMKSDRPTGLFGSSEIHSGNLQMFPKWRGLLARYADEKRKCEAAACGKQWRSLLEGLRGQDRMAQLRGLNQVFNKTRYIDDETNWNTPDHWETPFQFLRRGGDCEDYAIAKYLALVELGVPVDDMRIAIVQDQNLGIAHAILVVAVDGKSWVLDNQISKVVPAASIRHYRPVYSVNANGWWLHRVA
jgi:predicted transglutaminase-like cysteine proteinase